MFSERSNGEDFEDTKEMKKGKLIVIEGIDSSGKTTQLELLKKHFSKQNITYKTADFPQYETSFYGKMIARFLRGEFGPLHEVNPYLISVIYAQDRGLAKDELKKWLDDGKYVLSNRYATSNMAHQAGRVSGQRRTAFVQWLGELEYEVVGIPKEDIVLFLDVPTQVAKELMTNDDRRQAYRKGAKKDMVEKDSEYLEHSARTYQWLAKKFPHWIRVKCTDRNSMLKSPEAIHEEIKEILAKKGIMR